ncbi:MAG: putative sulfate exporter family transporter [Alistipes sp.]|nr:putative sulfate exporter family transporter [Alistipes sp.]
MKQLFEKLRVEDWTAVWMAIPLLLLAIVCPGRMPSVPSTLVGEVAWYNIALLFAIVLVVLYAGCAIMGRRLRGMLPSLAVVFALSLLAQVVAKIPLVAEYGFESVFFSVIFGLAIRNLWHVPDWMKPAIQGEFFIKIGVVCLGATILFSDVMKSGVFGLVQACLVVALVWMFAFRFSKRQGVDERSAMILSSGVSICGVSACITAARVAGGDDRKLSYIVSLVLIIVVPMIYLMPWLAGLILPRMFEPAVAQEVAGAWIGGTIDTTSGVVASSEMVGREALSHAVIIKGAQNVLIGVVAFFIALYLSARSETGRTQRPSLGVVWEKFPKFILGFVGASLLFSLLQSGDLLTVNAKGKLVEPAVAKMFSTLFFSLAFVCIGLDTRLKEIVSKENRNLLRSFLVAQTFNIVVTFLIACCLFGLLKPLWA